MRRAAPLSVGHYSIRLGGGAPSAFAGSLRRNVASVPHRSSTPFRTSSRVRPGLLLAGTALIAPLTVHHLSSGDGNSAGDSAGYPIASPNEGDWLSVGASKQPEAPALGEESTPEVASAESSPAPPPSVKEATTPKSGDHLDTAAAVDPPATPEITAVAAGQPSAEPTSSPSELLQRPTEPPQQRPATAPAEAVPSLVAPVPAEPSPAASADSASADGYSVQKYKYVIIGTGTAAYNALAVIAHKDPDASVLMVGEETAKPYMRPPLSKELWNSSDDPKGAEYAFTNWMGKEERLFYKELKMKNLKILRGTRAQSIKAKHKAVILGDDSIVFYDKCLVATGGKPNTPPFPVEGDHPDRVTTYRNLADFQALFERSGSSVHITVVGGGFLGSELSAGLAARAKMSGATITQVFPEAGCMGLALPEYLSEDATNNMLDEGVKVIPNKLVAKLDTSGDGVVVHLQDDTSFKSDHVVVCTGIDTDKEFALQSGLELDEVNGGIVVNAELQALSDIYVAGDASSFYDVGLKTRRRVEHYNHAVSSGRVAGGNMTGERNVFSHQSSFWSDLPGISYEAVGLVDSQLRTVGIFAKQPDDGPKKYGKGVVYYLKDNRVVGVLTWNLGGKMSQARKLIAKGKKVYNSKDLADWIGLEES